MSDATLPSRPSTEPPALPAEVVRVILVSLSLAHRQFQRELRAAVRAGDTTKQEEAKRRLRAIHGDGGSIGAWDLFQPQAHLFAEGRLLEALHVAQAQDALQLSLDEAPGELCAPYAGLDATHLRILLSARPSTPAFNDARSHAPIEVLETALQSMSGMRGYRVARRQIHVEVGALQALTPPAATVRSLDCADLPEMHALQQRGIREAWCAAVAELAGIHGRLTRPAHPLPDGLRPRDAARCDVLQGPLERVEQLLTQSRLRAGEPLATLLRHCQILTEGSGMATVAAVQISERKRVDLLERAAAAAAAAYRTPATMHAFVEGADARIVGYNEAFVAWARPAYGGILDGTEAEASARLAGWQWSDQHATT